MTSRAAPASTTCWQVCQAYSRALPLSNLHAGDQQGSLPAAGLSQCPHLKIQVPRSQDCVARYCNTVCMAQKPMTLHSGLECSLCALAIIDNAQVCCMHDTGMHRCLGCAKPRGLQPSFWPCCSLQQRGPPVAVSASTVSSAALSAAAPPICHAGRRVSPDPIPAAAAGGSCRDVPQDHRLRELQVANEALVAMLDREKGNCRAAQERQQELEMHMQEVSAPVHQLQSSLRPCTRKISGCTVARCLHGRKRPLCLPAGVVTLHTLRTGYVLGHVPAATPELSCGAQAVLQHI